MGQYHSIYNITKKEFITPHALGDGAKLLEWHGGFTTLGLAVLLSNSNGRGGGDLYNLDNKNLQALIDTVSGRWAGDRIVVQGDYVEKTDPAFISENRLEKFTNISDMVLRAILTDNYFRQEIIENNSYVDLSVQRVAQEIEDLYGKTSKKVKG